MRAMASAMALWVNDFGVGEGVKRDRVTNEASRAPFFHCGVERVFSDSASDGALRAGTLFKSSIQLQLGTTQSIAEKKRCAGSRDAGNPFRGIKSSSFKAAPSAANTRAGARAAHSAAGHPPRSPSHPQDRQSRETRVESARRRHCCLRDGPSRGRCPPPASPVSAATRASDSPRRNRQVEVTRARSPKRPSGRHVEWVGGGGGGGGRETRGGWERGGRSGGEVGREGAARGARGAAAEVPFT